MEGRPRMTDVLPSADWSADALLPLAAAVEGSSEHPLARAVVAAAVERGLNVPQVADFDSTPGGGVRGKVAGRLVLVGGQSFLESEGVAGLDALGDRAAALQEQGRTVFY